MRLEEFQHTAHFTEGELRAPAHGMLSSQRFLTKNGIPLVPYPPFSPDLALNNLLVSLGGKTPPEGNDLPIWKRQNKKEHKMASKSASSKT